MGSFAQTFEDAAPCLLARDYKDPPSLVFDNGGVQHETLYSTPPDAYRVRPAARFSRLVGSYPHH
jgi:hypothetical protein